MSDTPNKRRDLSEISHLFLSSVRDKQTGGAPRPVRKPPQKQQVSIDLTPEEFAQVFGGAQPAAGREPSPRTAPVYAVLGPHLNGKQFDRVKEYARSLASHNERIGLIELDASEFRLMCFDTGVETETGAPAAEIDEECVEPRQIGDAIEELNWDVDRWLVLLPSPRTPEARNLLREIDQWVLLSTCDHDGVVACYRTLKGLAEVHRPRLSVALLDARDPEEAKAVARKLASVCQQFLNWPIDSETYVTPAPGVAEHTVMVWRPTRDKAQMASGMHWPIVASFLSRAKQSAADEEALRAERNDEIDAIDSPAEQADDSAPAEPVRETVVDVVVPTPVAPAAQPPVAEISLPIDAPIAPAEPMRLSTAGDEAEVIDLPNGDGSEESILSAILKQEGTIECPVRPPMCPSARLSVGRDRRLTLLAVARQGLADLKLIGQAYRWLVENRALIGMAVPQLTIDGHSHPQLRLLVDHADLTADLLQPMLQSSTVTVQTYRKLRWSGRAGLLLEAA